MFLLYEALLVDFGVRQPFIWSKICFHSQIYTYLQFLLVITTTLLIYESLVVLFFQFAFL